MYDLEMYNIIICQLRKLLLDRSLDTGHFFVLLKDIRQRPNRRNLELVDLAMALCVMLLDVFKVCGFFESGVVLFHSC